MSHPSKVKGSNFERELVNEAKEYGLPAERAFASNGKALGETEGVDLRIAGIRFQAKRRKKLADFLQIPDGCDAVACRQDRGDTLVIMDWKKFLQLLKTEDD